MNQIFKAQVILATSLKGGEDSYGYSISDTSGL